MTITFLIMRCLFLIVHFVYNKLKEWSKDTFSLEELYDMFKDEFKNVKISWQ